MGPAATHSLPTTAGKETGSHGDAQAPLPAQVSHRQGQDGLRAEAQVTPPQTLPQVTLPAHISAFGGATSATVAQMRAAAHLPAHAAPLAAQAARDDGLSMTVLPHAAHMAIESPDGDLAVHMRVRQGSAEITVGGSMAPIFEARAPEARAALASEGLALGRFDSGQQGGGAQGQSAPETPEQTAPPPAGYRPNQSISLPATAADGHIHVTA